MQTATWEDVGEKMRVLWYAGLAKGLSELRGKEMERGLAEFYRSRRSSPQASESDDE